MKQSSTVAKVYAAPAKPTPLGAAIIAACIAILMGVLLMLVERLLL